MEQLSEDIILTPDQVHWLTRDQAWHYRIIPFQKSSETFDVYADADTDIKAISAELEIITGLRVKALPLTTDRITRLLSKYYLKEGGGAGRYRSSDIKNTDNFLNDIIAEAKSLKSSDIHIECYEQKCRIRIRIDGLLVERHLLKHDDYPALINKLKILANLDIAEKRLPQDGRIKFRSGNDQFDIRVSVLPALYGEKAVLRLLNNDATNIDLNNLGMSTLDMDNYLEGVRRPTGLVIISGPTGSGKTTTLYATLKLLNKETRNIVTVEDPVEYTLEGINQVQLKESIGLGFASALRTFLRQDPDVIMVGEIRDPETANMAIRASLTGHLVLSTIHTNTAWGTVSRLIDMQIPSFLVANTLTTSVAQRLVRLLCPHCKRSVDLKTNLYPKQFRPFRQLATHYLASGCQECHYTGYKGRKAVYEVIPIDRELAYEIKNGHLQVDEMLRERGIRTLAENAFDLFGDGHTSLEEIYPLLFNY